MAWNALITAVRGGRPPFGSPLTQEVRRLSFIPPPSCLTQYKGELRKRGVGRSWQGYGKHKEWLRQWTPVDTPSHTHTQSHTHTHTCTHTLSAARTHFKSVVYLNYLGLLSQNVAAHSLWLIKVVLLRQVGTVPLLPLFLSASCLCFGIRRSTGKAKDFLRASWGWSLWLLQAKAGQGRARKPKAPWSEPKTQTGGGKERPTQKQKHLRCSCHSPIFESLATKLMLLSLLGRGGGVLE